MYTRAVNEPRVPTTTAYTYAAGQSKCIHPQYKTGFRSTHPFPIGVLLFPVGAVEILSIEANHGDSKAHLDKATEDMRPIGLALLTKHVGDSLDDCTGLLRDELLLVLTRARTM